MKKIFISLFFVSLFLLSACEDFLSEMPTKGSNQKIEAIEQLEGLLNNPPYGEHNNISVFSSDDYDIPLDIYDIRPTSFSSTYLYFYTFNTTEIVGLASDTFWAELYKQIYIANLIIENADQVTGEPALKARVKAEAYFLRAYNNWVLANYYCLPYCAANLEEMGLPKRDNTDMEATLSRMTLKETYEYIESDISEALKIDVEDFTNTWRISKATVNAFLSRYYMFKGEYEKAVEAADYALSHSGAASLVDYNTLKAGTSYPSYDPPLTFCETYSYVESSPTLFNWPEFYYIRINTSSWLILSQNLIDLFDSSFDMRYEWFVKYANRTHGVTSPNILSYEKFAYGSFIPSGPNVPEVLLNKAECLLRQSTPSLQAAMNTINLLRDNRMRPECPDIHMNFTSRDEALRKVLEERRRELPFSYRFLDIRRFAVNETPWDDVNITRTFYSFHEGVVDKSKTENYTLPVGSRRYAHPINNVEIAASRGSLKQNIY
jgi:tetratricopeptide (TPR) repeat protein